MDVNVAKENVALNKLSGRVRCVSADALRPAFPFLGKFDMIVSNPPYITGQEMKELPKSVADYEPHLALYGGELEKCARAMALRTASEFFADRAYEDDGSLVNRRLEGAVIHDEEVAIARTVKMIKEKKVTTIHGTEIELDCRSVCVHGDNEKALAFVRRIREAFAAEGIEIAPLHELV